LQIDVVEDPATDDHVEAGGLKPRALNGRGHELGSPTAGEQLGPPPGYAEDAGGEIKRRDDRAPREEGKRQVALTAAEVQYPRAGDDPSCAQHRLVIVDWIDGGHRVRVELLCKRVMKDLLPIPAFLQMREVVSRVHYVRI